MCYDKYYSVVIKEKIHILEICPGCAKQFASCCFTRSNDITNGMCPICTMYAHIFVPGLFN